MSAGNPDQKNYVYAVLSSLMQENLWLSIQTVEGFFVLRQSLLHHQAWVTLLDLPGKCTKAGNLQEGLVQNGLVRTRLWLIYGSCMMHT